MAFFDTEMLTRIREQARLGGKGAAEAALNRKAFDSSIKHLDPPGKLDPDLWVQIVLSACLAATAVCQCIREDGEVSPHIGTPDMAPDMLRLRSSMDSSQSPGHECYTHRLNSGSKGPVARRVPFPKGRSSWSTIEMLPGLELEKERRREQLLSGEVPSPPGAPEATGRVARNWLHADPKKRPRPREETSLDAPSLSSPTAPHERSNPSLASCTDGVSDTLREVLADVRPDWKDKEICAVLEKLAKIQIASTQQLHLALETGGAVGVNNQLKEVGEKAFKLDTLEKLRVALKC